MARESTIRGGTVVGIKRIVPTWHGAVQILALGLTNGITDKVKRDAREELLRLGALASEIEPGKGHTAQVAEAVHQLSVPRGDQHAALKSLREVAAVVDAEIARLDVAKGEW